MAPPLTVSPTLEDLNTLADMTTENIRDIWTARFGGLMAPIDKVAEAGPFFAAAFAVMRERKSAQLDHSTQQIRIF